MNALLRHTVLIMMVWLTAAGVCFGKQVYLKDGGVIDAQSAWRQGSKVYVKVNRDIVADFAANEIDLRRTFPKSASRQVKKVAAVPAEPKKAAGPQAPAAAAPANIESKPAGSPAPPTTKPPVPTVAPGQKPATPPAPPVVKEPQPAAAPTPAEPAAPADKAELQRRSQEAAKMMAEAVVNKDSEKMKKALELQKSAIPEQGAPAPIKPGFPLAFILLILAVCLLIIAAQWIIFQKAGVAGWKCLIPFYNMYILMQIAGKPGWWMFLLFIPLVGVAIMLFAMLSLAKRFGKGELYGVGLFFLPMIFFPLLAFGGSEYEG